jgi:hypothetical protein
VTVNTIPLAEARGLNAKRFHWTFAGQPAEQLVRENFLRHATAIARRVALPGLAGSVRNRACRGLR